MIKNNQERGIGLILVILIVALFAIWVFTGGPETSTQGDKPFINPYANSSAPLKTYGPGDSH